jgi:hypothetical protein
MSGQPNRYANSAEKFRNEYMDALNSRANVDEFNLQANKNYKATGTLPPNVKAMVDNRTTTEILADTEKLKLNIISELKPVMNSATASVVVQKIQTASVNADGSFLIWVAQNIPEIVRNLKRKYAIGIKGDARDATNIVLYLSEMYSKIKEYSGSVKTYFDTAGESKVGLSEGDLDTLRREYEIIVARLKTKYPNFRDFRAGQFSANKLIDTTTKKIQSLFSLLTSQKYKDTIQDLQGVSGSFQLEQVNGFNDMAKAMFELIDNLPSVHKVRALYSQLERSLENKDEQLTINILQSISDLFPSRNEVDEINRIFDVHGPTTKPRPLESYNGAPKPDLINKITPKQRIKATNEIEAYEQRIKEIRKEIKVLNGYLNEYQLYLHRNDELMADDEIKDTKDAMANIIDVIEQYEVEINHCESEQENIMSMLEGRTPYAPFPFLPKPPTSAPLPKPPTNIPTQKPPTNTPTQKQNDDEEFVDAEDETITPQTIEDLENERDRIEAELEAAIKANDLDLEEDLRKQLKALKTEIMNRRKPRTAGTGLKKRRGRPKGSGISFKDNIDHDKGIQPVKKYHPFGKYFVNSHKLNNGSVLSIKSKSGTNVREYPSKTVSRNLGHVIKTIIGGGVPSWNDMEKLTDDEKDYLYKVSKRAEFSDKITIPTPSKDQQEKDIHEFDVCKGEIMAGNDSKELIKKFKLLIIKLSKNGSIPKREASEVMQELLELGY